MESIAIRLKNYSSLFHISLLLTHLFIRSPHMGARFPFTVPLVDVVDTICAFFAHILDELKIHAALLQLIGTLD